MRALISVWHKTGVVELAQRLRALGWEIVSSGGTARVLAAAGVETLAVGDVTGSAEMLDGRVKTLHPAIHGGILADRSKPGHLRQLAQRGIAPIDLVVCNLYPFGQQPEPEMIDIGGPAMVRAAAKNFGDTAGGVGVVTDPGDYDAVADELERSGSLSPVTRRRLARTAFAHTAAYDAAIVTWLDETEPAHDAETVGEMMHETEPAHDTETVHQTEPGRDTETGGDAETGRTRGSGGLPATIHIALELAEACRYGENPHQLGARYRPAGSTTWWDHAYQHGGLALSYLNFFDADAAWRIVHDLGDAEGRPTAVIVKHANPCGAASADDLAAAFQRAYDCDPRSAFGGIVAFNGIVDMAAAKRMHAAAQADVVIAAGYEAGVVELLAAKRRNTRVLEAPRPESVGWSLRQINGGWLAQSPHRFASDPAQWQVVTRRQPTDGELADARFAWRVCGHVSSNAIVLAKDRTAWGIGAGQQNRVESGLLAASKAEGRAAGGACASDAFYPFADGVDAAAAAGVAVVVQPGGAQSDDTVIARADELGLAMLFTHERQFRH